jgi:oxalate decarboxylase/phosphoglucose isomerase-like protein (cupin superfamily)|tara:strand:- start:6242 stop:6652 length:411 start_codon:yes stop_codon:yes gene_type:complete
MGLSKVKQMTTPTITDGRGNLGFLENKTHVPFDIKRIYYLYDVPKGQQRGFHAHYELEQVIFALKGSFDLVLDDGKEKKTYHLNSPNSFIVIPKMIWRELNNFSENAICMVIASMSFNEADYIRDYDTFLEAVQKE